MSIYENKTIINGEVFTDLARLANYVMAKGDENKTKLNPNASKCAGDMYYVVDRAVSKLSSINFLENTSSVDCFRGSPEKIVEFMENYKPEKVVKMLRDRKNELASALKTFNYSENRTELFLAAEKEKARLMKLYKAWKVGEYELQYAELARLKSLKEILARYPEGSVPFLNVKFDEGIISDDAMDIIIDELFALPIVSNKIK